MDANPYAAGNDFDAYDDTRRTSVLAVFSLVLSLVCCIPGLGLLGAGCGVGALVGIGTSRGRVGGKGLAIAAIVVGVLVSLAWVAGYYGVKVAFEQMLTTSQKIVSSIESGDYDAARGALAPPLDGMSDGDFAAFAAAYRAELGSYKSGPDTLGAYIQMFTDPLVSQQMQSPPPIGNAIPVPIEFEQETVVVFLGADQQGGEITELVYPLPDGSFLRLSDFVGSPQSVSQPAADNPDAP